MDNVNYNFEILCALYDAKRMAGNDAKFNKPIIVTIVSIIECMLFDFVDRIQGHVYDKVPNLEAATIADLKSKKGIDVLEKLITQAKKHNLLRVGAGRDKFYSDLDMLRKLRNRTHIQNMFWYPPPNEVHAFSATNLRIAERVFLLVIEAMCNAYPRWDRGPIPMVEFPKPWI